MQEPTSSLLTRLALRFPYISALNSSLPKFQQHVPAKFLASNSFKLINPRAHRVATDSVSLRLPERLLKGKGDEEVLARFTRGFFGGWVFAVERVGMRWGLWRWFPVGYDVGLENSPKTIWYAKDVWATHLHPVGTKLAGAFQVVDRCLKAEEEDGQGEGKEGSGSYVDNAFGRNETTFAGCHRFMVRRGLSPVEGEGEDEMVEISLVHFRCNPMEDKDNAAEIIAWFHKLYASALFMDAMRWVLKP